MTENTPIDSERAEKLDRLMRYCAFAAKKYGLAQMPRLCLGKGPISERTKDGKDYVEVGTYLPELNLIQVSETSPDLLKTLAHEFVHLSQEEAGTSVHAKALRKGIPVDPAGRDLEEIAVDIEAVRDVEQFKIWEISDALRVTKLRTAKALELRKKLPVQSP